MERLSSTLFGPHGISPDQSSLHSARSGPVSVGEGTWGVARSELPGGRPPEPLPGWTTLGLRTLAKANRRCGRSEFPKATAAPPLGPA